MRGRKPYSNEFKHEAVKLVREQGLPRRQVATDLGIDLDTLRRWLDDATTKAANPPTSAPSPAEAVSLCGRPCESLPGGHDLPGAGAGLQWLRRLAHEHPERIERFYNRQRRHSTLGSLSPREAERR